MNLSNHYRHAHPEIKIGKKDQTVIDEAEAWKGEATKQLKKLNAIKQRNKRLRGKTTTGPAAKRIRTTGPKTTMFTAIVVPPPLDLSKLGAPATQTITDTQQQETITKPTQPTSQSTTQETNAGQVESGGDIVAKGISTNIYQIVLGHDTNVLNTEKRIVEIITQGTQITIYNVITCYETFFVFLHNDTIYNVLKSEISDCVIKNVVAKKRKP